MKRKAVAPMKIVKWLDENLEPMICVCLLSLMSVILFIQVVMRRGFNNSLVWSEEMARYIFIWLIYFSISYSAKQISHIKIEASLGLFPYFLRPYVTMLGNLLFLAYAVIIVHTGLDMVNRQVMMGSLSPAMEIPMWIVWLAPVVGFSFTAVRQLQIVIFKDIKGIVKGTWKEELAKKELEEKAHSKESE